MKINNQINPACTECKLHEPKGTSVCLKGSGVDGKKKLMIFADQPDYFANNARKGFVLDVLDFWAYILSCMSISIEDVAFDYTVRCYNKAGVASTKAARGPIIIACSSYRFKSIDKVEPKAIVVSGSASLEAFTGKTKVSDYHENTVKAWEGRVRKHVPHVWVCHSAAFAMTAASESIPIFRTVWQAAEEAGLEPVINPSAINLVWKMKK